MPDEKPLSEPTDRNLLLLLMEKIDGQGQILGEMRARLEEAHTEIRDHGLRLEEARTEIRDQGARLEEARTEIRGQSVMFEEMRAQNRTTIEAVHARCDALESEMHDGFARQDRRFDVLESVVRSHSDQFQVVNARLDGISSDVQGLKVDVQGLKGDVKEVRTDLRRVETKVERLESRFNAFDRP